MSFTKKSAKKTKTYSSEQQAIIKHTKGPALVVAGPGTGKTETIIAAIVYLLSQGVNPKHILVLTYSKATQLDFVKRLYHKIGTQAQFVKIYTSHAFGLAIIHQHNNLLTKKLKQSNLSTFINTPEPDEPNYKTPDFEKMLQLPLQLFTKHPETLTQLPYTHLFVDEVQDINQTQAELFTLLAQNISCSLLVGDQKQSIYGFRGAGVKQWRYLTKQLKPKRFQLTQSYRLTQQTLAFANAFASSFSNDPPLTSNHQGEKPKRVKLDSVSQQTEYLAKEITELLNQGYALNEIGVIARTRPPLQQLKRALDTHGIDATEDDYHIIEPWLAYFKALVYLAKWSLNPNQSAARQSVSTLNTCLTRLFTLAKIPEERHPTLHQNIAQHGLSKFKIPRDRKNIKNKRAYVRVNNLRNKVVHAIQQSDTEAGIQLLIDALLTFIRERETAKARKRIQQYLSRIKVQLRGYHWDHIKPEMLNPISHDTGVTLTTIHIAKGKEWKVVFILNVVEGEIPLRFAKTDESIYDERSLFYTAITRHSEKLYLLETPFIKTDFPKGKGRQINTFYKQSSLTKPYLKYLDLESTTKHSKAA